MLLTAFVFFIILSILIFVHELGHYTVARLVGVHVEEFGFGLPPRIWGKQVGKTIYSINWLPIGGFVKLAGEDDEQGSHVGFTQKNAKHFFWARSKKERAAILLAGVTMNFVLAVGILSYLLVGGLTVPARRVDIVNVLPDSPAHSAGLLAGDIVVSIASPELQSVYTASELRSIIVSHAGTSVTLHVLRSGQKMTIDVTPRKTWPEGSGPVGIQLNDLKELKFPWWRAPWEAVVISVERMWEMLAGMGALVVRIASLKPVGSDIAGPIGIAQVTGQAVKFGTRAVLEFMSILSLNLALLNALPIPALDGGRLLFVVLEKFLGRRIKPAFERSTHQVGMIILLILVALISVNDILRLARGG